jgi:hypothetical protein
MNRAARISASDRPVLIHIDTLCIDGLALAPVQVRQLRAAFEAELTCLASVEQRSTAWTSEARPVQHAAAVQAQHPLQAAPLGMLIGRTVWAAMAGRE